MHANVFIDSHPTNHRHYPSALKIPDRTDKKKYTVYTVYIIYALDKQERDETGAC
jgi:hypothetical protein